MSLTHLQWRGWARPRWRLQWGVCSLAEGWADRRWEVSDAPPAPPLASLPTLLPSSAQSSGIVLLKFHWFMFVFFSLLLLFWKGVLPPVTPEAWHSACSAPHSLRGNVKCRVPEGVWTIYCTDGRDRSHCLCFGDCSVDRSNRIQQGITAYWVLKLDEIRLTEMHSKVGCERSVKGLWSFHRKFFDWTYLNLEFLPQQ